MLSVGQAGGDGANRPIRIGPASSVPTGPSVPAGPGPTGPASSVPAGPGPAGAVSSDQAPGPVQIRRMFDELYYAIEVAKQMVDENAATAMDQEEYLTRYKTVEDKINTLNKKIDDLKAQKKRKLALVGRLCLLEDNIKNKEGTLDFFDEKLWNLLIEKVLVKRNQTLELIYYAGLKNEIKIQ